MTVLGQDSSSERTQKPSTDPVSSIAKSLKDASTALQVLVHDQKIPGAVIVASWKGEIVLAEAVGMARKESKRPMRRDSIFRIYSMTKAVTSVAVMQLVEQGDVVLDKPISNYLTELKDLRVVGDSKAERTLETANASPTVRDLLRHTAGFTYGIFGDTSVDRQYRQSGILSSGDTNQMFITKLSRIPLLHQPGTRFHYGVSSDVLGRLVEVVSGKPLDEYFQGSIFEPLGMSDTSFFVAKTKADRLVDNFGPVENGGLKTLEKGETSPFLRKPNFLSGGGGLVSTADDYMRFCQMLIGRGQLDQSRLLSEDSVEQMTQNQIPIESLPIKVNGYPSPGVGFGLGFSVVVQQIPGYEHVPIDEYGWSGAASTHFWISPKDELAVVLLSQVMPFTMSCESAVKPIIYGAIHNSNR